MSSAGSRERSIRIRREVRDARLTNWPLRNDGVWPWLLLLACLGGGVGVAFVARQPWTGVATVVALLTSMWRLWIPVTFELGPRGVIQTVFGRSYRINWREFARYRLYRSGVLLLVDPNPSPLDSFRGLFIRFDDSRDALIAVVQLYVGSAGPPDSTLSVRNGRDGRD